MNIRLTHFIELFRMETTIDDEGFEVTEDIALAHVRVTVKTVMEAKHGRTVVSFLQLQFFFVSGLFQTSPWIPDASLSQTTADITSSPLRIFVTRVCTGKS